MSVVEVAAYLSVTKWMVYDLVKERKIPFTYVGKRPRFHRPTIDKWMEKRLIPVAA